MTLIKFRRGDHAGICFGSVDDDESFRVVEDSGDCGADAPHIDYQSILYH